MRIVKNGHPTTRQQWKCPASRRPSGEGPSGSARVPDGCPLTNGQFDALSLISEGLSLKEAGLRLGRSRSAIQSRLCVAYAALGVPGRGQVAAVVVMKDSGWLGAPSREPHVRDDSRDVTPAQLAYNAAFVAHCRERSAETAFVLEASFNVMELREGLLFRPRPRTNIHDMTLGMALALSRPIPV